MIYRFSIHLFHIVLLVFVHFALSGQIVTIDPPFFTIDSTITVTYDATQGNGGLNGVAQVYTHTGIITQQAGAGNWQNVQGNWGTDDPRVKMTNIGDNKHQITYNIRDFYNISGNPTVNQLAFVFRNVSGSREGKTSTNGDIFVDLPEPGEFSSFFQSPTERHLIVEQGSSLDIEVVSSASSEIRIFDNDVLILEEMRATSASIDYIPVTDGDHVIRFEITKGAIFVEDSFSFVYNPQFQVADPPMEIKPGLNRISSTEVILSLFAPGKNHIFLLSNLNDHKVTQQLVLNQSTDGNTWWIQLENLDPDRLYEYQFLVDGKFKIADPISELVLDSDHDGGVSNFSNLPSFPKDKTEGRLSIFKTVKDEFNWTDGGFQNPKKEDLVVYEILLRDFLSSHSYLDLKDTLSYLKRLGINAIELMPVQEFEANDSWGYNPSFHMALDKYYGDPEDFKSLINAAHENDIAVIIDVVFNHAFGQSPLVQLYWDQTNNRPSIESPYLNPIARHPFNVGFDFNHEKQATKNFVKQVLQYWMDEFHIDGFRFDLSKGLTQNFTTNNDQMSFYDASRIAILKEYADYIWSIDDDNFVIMEHFADNDEEKELAEYGMMLWGNGNHNFNESTMGYHDDSKSDFTWQSYQERNWNVPHIMGYMESHDEERLMYRNLNFGNVGSGYNVKTLNTALDRIEMAAVFFFSIPGPKMIWQFGELGYDFSINRCVSGAVAGCRLDKKPIRWDYQNQSNRLDLFEVYRQMINLKIEEDLFETDNFILDLNAEIKSIQLLSDAGNAVVIGNFDVSNRTVNETFPHGGTWYDFFSGEIVSLRSATYTANYSPGEYHIYFDEKKDLISSIPTLEELGLRINLYPNPASDFINLSISAEISMDLNAVLIDHQGRTIRKLEPIKVLNGNYNRKIDVGDLISGMYYLQLGNERGVSLLPVSVVK